MTSIIGGLFGSRAAHSGAKAIGEGDLQAANLVQNANIAGNTGISQAAGAAQTGVSTAAAGGGQMVSNAAGQGQAGVSNALGDGQAGVSQGLNGSYSTLNPFISTGQSSAGNLMSMLAPGGSLTQTFDASKMEQYDPGYQFRIDQGSKALQRAAAARGSALGGGTLTALSNYNQNAASAEYGNAFNRFQQQQQQQYGMQLGAAQLGVNPAMQLSSQDVQTGEFNAGLGMNASQFNAGLGMNAAQFGAGMGYNAAVYGGNAGMNAADLQAQNSNLAAQYAGNALMNKGGAQAAGDVGSANALSGALSGIGKAATGYETYGLLTGGFGGGATGASPMNPWAMIPGATMPMGGLPGQAPAVPMPSYQLPPMFGTTAPAPYQG